MNWTRGWTRPSEAVLACHWPDTLLQLQSRVLTLQRNIHLTQLDKTSRQNKPTNSNTIYFLPGHWVGLVWVEVGVGGGGWQCSGGCAGLYLYFYTSRARLLWQPSKDTGERNDKNITHRTSFSLLAALIWVEWYFEGLEIRQSPGWDQIPDKENYYSASKKIALYKCRKCKRSFTSTLNSIYTFLDKSSVRSAQFYIGF